MLAMPRDLFPLWTLLDPLPSSSRHLFPVQPFRLRFLCLSSLDHRLERVRAEEVRRRRGWWRE